MRLEHPIWHRPSMQWWFQKQSRPVLHFSGSLGFLGLGLELLSRMERTLRFAGLVMDGFMDVTVLVRGSVVNCAVVMRRRVDMVYTVDG